MDEEYVEKTKPLFDPYVSKLWTILIIPHRSLGMPYSLLFYFTSDAL